MSKRASITLNPEVETEPNLATETAPLPETEAHAYNGFAPAADKPARPPAAAQRALNIGTIVKLVFAGLAVASLVLLWKNRRP